MNSAVIAIVAAECRAAAEKETTLEGRLKAAFSVARDHWMATDENDQLNGAVVAIHGISNDEDKRRLELEMKSLRALNAAMSGVPVDFAGLELPEKPIGIVALWKAAKAA